MLACSGTPMREDLLAYSVVRAAPTHFQLLTPTRWMVMQDAGIGQSKVRQGISGGGKAAISTQVQEQLAARWTKDVAAVTGCATYTELRNAHGLAAQARR
jgi:hypothetical protein